jgi:predicted permease
MNQSESDRRYIMLAMRIMGDFGLSIALPVVAFAMIGKRLDAKYGTSPWLIILGFALAAMLSGYLIWKKAKRYGRDYEAIGKSESVKPPSS